MKRSIGEQQDAMGRIQERLVSSGMGTPCNLIVRKSEKWMQIRGNINQQGKFVAQYSNPIEVPERLDCHFKTETAMKLLVAWIIEESRNPGQASAVFEGRVPLPPQRIDLGGDTALLVVCNSEGQPVCKGPVSDWPTHADIIEESVMENNKL